MGAGPVGCVTALHFARRGVPCVVLERSREPSEKVCGEGLMPHGVRELRALGLGDVLTAIGAQPFRGIGYHAAGSSVVGAFPGADRGDVGFGVRRLRLHRELQRLIEVEPLVELRRGVTVTGLEVGQGSARLKTSEGEVVAPLVVGADGLHSTVRRLAGLKRTSRGRPRFGARLHLRLRDGVELPLEVRVYLDEGLEFYVTPTGPREVNIALLCEKQVTRTFRGDLHAGLMGRIAAFEPLAQLVEGTEPLSDAALIGPLLQETYAGFGERVALVGDAAGFIDGITGEGMSLGFLAARALVETVAEPMREGRLCAADLAHYDARRLRESKGLTRLTRLVLWGIRHRWLARWVVRNLARRPATFERVLAVNVGAVPLRRFGLRHVVGALLGV